MNAVNRKTILDLAAQATDNKPLHDLLLTVAGMIDGDGRVSTPDDHERWGEIAGPSGAFGRGLMLSRNRSEVYPPWPKVKGATRKAKVA